MRAQVTIIVGMLITTWPAGAFEFRYANTSPVQLTDTVSGVATAKTAGTIQVSDIIVKLSGVRDLDKHRQVCSWRKKTFDPNPNKFPPSVDAAAYKAFCDANPRGTKPPRGGKYAYKCELAFTAVDQMAKLKEIVNGKNVNCKIPSEDDMKQFWDVGLHKSRSGDKEYPGHCYIGAKSVSATLIGTGWASMVTDFNHSIIDPEYETLRKILVDDFNKIESGSSKFRSSRVICLSDDNYRTNPDWYNN